MPWHQICSETFGRNLNTVQMYVGWPVGIILDICDQRIIILISSFIKWIYIFEIGWRLLIRSVLRTRTASNRRERKLSTKNQLYRVHACDEFKKKILPRTKLLGRVRYNHEPYNVDTSSDDRIKGRKAGRHPLSWRPLCRITSYSFPFFSHRILSTFFSLFSNARAAVRILRATLTRKESWAPVFIVLERTNVCTYPFRRSCSHFTWVIILLLLINVELFSYSFWAPLCKSNILLPTTCIHKFIYSYICVQKYYYYY